MTCGFARQSGGQVRTYSEVGEGTAICIYLPRHRGEVEEDGARTAARPPRATEGETVLVVDHGPTVRMLVTEVLEELGHGAIELPTARPAESTALGCAHRPACHGCRPARRHERTPDGQGRARPDLKVLFIAGYAENAVLGNGRLEPGMQVMTKPFVMEALAARIKELIGSG